MPITFKIENPVAVVSESLHVKKATEFKNFLYTPEAQRIWAKTGFRPVDPGVAAEFASSFPVPSKLWTIKDLGGWKSVDKELFDKNDGSITKIYKEATG
ncbi:Probable sulfate ABC transporter%2C sulfate-binding protein SubI [Mycobacteroides abscessus]|nr:Probable sulfate ABC transporter%2C sulfate-binding protein SubI [Mycobacteroides abscessus]